MEGEENVQMNFELPGHMLPRAPRIGWRFMAKLLNSGAA